MKNFLKLILLGWSLKLAIWRCRRFDKTSDEYRLAKHYQHALDTLDHKEQDIQALILDTQKLQDQYRDRKEISELLTLVLHFLDQTKKLKND